MSDLMQLYLEIAFGTFLTGIGALAISAACVLPYIVKTDRMWKLSQENTDE